MGVNINWQRGVAPNIVGNALSAFQQGEKIGEEVRRRKALKAFTDNPDDENAMLKLMRVDPELGFRASEWRRRRAQDQRDQQFNEAAAGYVGGESGVIPQSPTARRDISPHSMSGAPNALAPFAGPQGHWPSPDEAPQLPDSGQQTRQVVSIIGKPTNREDALFLKMLRTDPKRALEIDSALRDRFADRLKQEHDGIAWGLSQLTGTDAQTYPARRAAIIERLAPLDLKVEAVLPEQFPGENSLRQIQMQGMDLKDQIAALISRDRAEAYRGNLEADNERADRNFESLDRDRRERRGETRRYHDQLDATRRRGQDKRGSSRLLQVRTMQEAMALPKGTKFRDPNGVVRTRP